MQLTGEHFYVLVATNSDSTVKPNITLFDNEIMADRYAKYYNAAYLIKK